MCNRFITTALPTALLVLLLGACASGDDQLETMNDHIQSIRLALCISTGQPGTRMSASTTQQESSNFQVQDWHLLPFSETAPVGSSSTSLSGNVAEQLERYEATSNFYDDKSVKIPDDTRSFLCYCRAGRATGDDDFTKGAINITGLNDVAATATTSDITFSPKVIYEGTTTKEIAQNIADYLTNIAQYIPTEKEDFFLEFVNNGHPIAASSTNVQKLATWAQTDGGVTTLPEISNEESIKGYPANINLPDGAAVVKWNFTEKKFEPQIQTTTEANINSLDRFVYPAELWYYANSPIRTSEELLTESFAYSTWENVLNAFGPVDSDEKVMRGGIHSVAVVNPLQYAVGRLQIKLSSTLEDADKYPLTAVFVSGQYSQAYDFTPNGSIDEKIIYDKYTVDEGYTMKGKYDNGTDIPPTNTLVFQTQDGKSVRFALEFENNSGQDFEGANGTVFNGTKFYLVGTIDLDAVDSDADTPDDVKHRVFTKDYITQGTVKISSLKEARTYLPDLLDPRLEIGIKLQTNWIQSSTTNVPL